LILSVDIGGTYTRFSVILLNNNNFEYPQNVKPFVFYTNSYDSFEDLLCEFEKKSDYSFKDLSGVSIAVPAPVTKNLKIQMLNVKWIIDVNKINKIFCGKDVIFINDFVAQAFGCLNLEPHNLKIIKSGIESYNSDFGIIGAGTGLGHCFMKFIKSENEYIPIPSEAGHNIFPFEFDEKDYLKFLKDKKKILRPTGNDVVSGKGLEYLFEFLTGKKISAGDIVNNNYYEVFKWFSKFSARVAQSFSLAVMSEGDTLYLSGGVFNKNEFLIDNDIFKEEFTNCSLKNNFLKNLTVLLIKDEYVALKGAAYYLFLRLKKK
jgi:glucokinase